MVASLDRGPRPSQRLCPGKSQAAEGQLDVPQVDVTEQRPGIPDGTVVPQSCYLVSEEQSYGFLQPDLLPFFLRPQTLEFKSFPVPGVPEFLCPFLCLFPGTGFGANPPIPTRPLGLKDKKSIREPAFSPVTAPVLVPATCIMTNDDLDCAGGKRNRGWRDSNPDLGRQAFQLGFTP